MDSKTPPDDGQDQSATDRLRYTNAWAARFSEANVEHLAYAASRNLPPDERDLDAQAWYFGFKAAMRVLEPEILGLCADNERMLELLGLATRAISLDTRPIVIKTRDGSDPDV